MASGRLAPATLQDPDLGHPDRTWDARSRGRGARAGTPRSLPVRARARPGRYGYGLPRPRSEVRPVSRIQAPPPRPRRHPWRRRFIREIQLTPWAQHPHILPLLDSGSVDGSLYYVMPYVEGESLRERLEREGQLPVDEAVAIARDVAAALEFAHGQGVIHRGM